MIHLEHRFRKIRIKVSGRAQTMLADIFGHIALGIGPIVLDNKAKTTMARIAIRVVA